MNYVKNVMLKHFYVLQIEFININFDYYFINVKLRKYLYTNLLNSIELTNLAMSVLDAM